jgi:hypothetical protein
MEQTSPTPRAKKAVINTGQDSDPLVREIGYLLELDDAALRQRWALVFKADPSPEAC